MAQIVVPKEEIKEETPKKKPQYRPITPLPPPESDGPIDSDTDLKVMNESLKVQDLRRDMLLRP